MVSRDEETLAGRLELAVTDIRFLENEPIDEAISLALAA